MSVESRKEVRNCFGLDDGSPTEQRTASFGIGRRELLRTVGLGAIGLGALGASVEVFGQDFEEKFLEEEDLQSEPPCPSIVKFSKTVTTGSASIYLCNCSCEDKTIRQRYRFSGTLMNNKECDESEEYIPNGSILLGSGTLTLKPVMCGSLNVLIGCSEGKFHIYQGPVKPPQRPLLLAAGEMLGTEGFETHAEGEKRCCAINHGEGTLNGGMLSQPGNPIRLCVSYRRQFRPLLTDAQKDPCTGRRVKWTGNFDGVLIRPCPEKG